jgi:hypothetical protein
MRRALLATPIMLVMAGCAQYWAKPGGTPAELEVAQANCEAASFARFPRVLQTNIITPGFIAPVTTSCTPGRDGPHCVTVGGEVIPPTYSTIDLNQAARHNSYQACLVAGGWRRAKDEAEAEAITRMGRAARPPSEAAIRGARAYCETVHKRRPNNTKPAQSREAFDQCVATRAHALDGS